MNDASEFELSKIRKNRILNNADNRIKKIQSLYSNKEFIPDSPIIDKTFTKPNVLTNITDIIDENNPAEPFVDNDVNNEDSNTYKIYETPQGTKSRSFESRIISLLVNYPYLTTVLLALFVRIFLSIHILSLFVFKSAVWPFIALQSLTRFLQSCQMDFRSHESENHYKLIRSLLIIGKFNPTYVNILIKTLSLSQLCMKYFSVYFVTFILIHIML